MRAPPPPSRSVVGQSQPAFAPKMSTVLDLLQKGTTAILCCERVKTVLRKAAKAAADPGAVGGRAPCAACGCLHMRGRADVCLDVCLNVCVCVDVSQCA